MQAMARRALDWPIILRLRIDYLRAGDDDRDDIIDTGTP